MGTNYYTKNKTCKECGHTPEGIHLGKSSGGWTFSFQYNGGRFYKNVKEMKAWLKGKKIEDEYGDTVSYKKFWEMVESKRKEKLSHASYMKKNHPTREGEYMIDGHSFSDCEFS